MESKNPACLRAALPSLLCARGLHGLARRGGGWMHFSSGGLHHLQERPSLKLQIALEDQSRCLAHFPQGSPLPLLPPPSTHAKQ